MAMPEHEGNRKPLTRWNACKKVRCARRYRPTDSLLTKLPTRPAAFTLVELLVAMSIVGILLGVAAPAFRGTLSNQHLDSVRDELAWDLRRARNLSLSRQSAVMLCPSADGATCAAAWTDGWLVFADEPGGVAGTLDVGDTRSAVRQPSGRAGSTSMAVQVRSRWSGTSVTADRFAFLGGSRGATGFVVICDERGIEHARTLRLSAAGEVDPGAWRNAAGALLDSWGVAVSCP